MEIPPIANVQESSFSEPTSVLSSLCDGISMSINKGTNLWDLSESTDWVSALADKFPNNKILHKFTHDVLQWDPKDPSRDLSPKQKTQLLQDLDNIKQLTIPLRDIQNAVVQTFKNIETYLNRGLGNPIDFQDMRRAFGNMHIIYDSGILPTATQRSLNTLLNSQDRQNWWGDFMQVKNELKGTNYEF